MPNPSIRHTQSAKILDLCKEIQNWKASSAHSWEIGSQHGYHQHPPAFYFETFPSLPVGTHRVSSTSMVKSHRFSLTCCLGPQRIISSSSSASSSVIRWVLGISQRNIGMDVRNQGLPPKVSMESPYTCSHYKYLFWVPMATFEGCTPLTTSAELQTAPVGQAGKMLPDLVRLEWDSANAAFELRWRNLMFLQHLLHIFCFGFVESLGKGESHLCFILTRHGGSNIRSAGCNIWMSTCKILHG